MTLEEIYKIIKEKGQRITKQKEIILTALIENRNKLLSVNQIQDILPEEENINNATIYRNMQNFVKLGILESMIDEKGYSKYVINCNKEHHHHLICLECGKMTFVLCDKNKFSDIAKEHDFEEEYHTLEMYGKCKECSKSDKS